MPVRFNRRRATAIIERPEGIILALMRHMAGMLPGGGVQPGESERDAVVRELVEETGLIVERVVFLFHHEAYAQTTAVFWVDTPGQPKPCNEIDRIAYYQPGASIRLSTEIHAVLHKFYQLKASEPERFVSTASL